MPSEKRKFRRLALEPIPCRVYQDGMLLELSIGGAFVASKRPLARGSLVTLELKLPKESPIQVRAQVQRTGDYFEGAGGKPQLGMGLSFVEIGADDRLAVMRFLKSTYDATRGAVQVAAELPARIRNGTRWAAGIVREIGERSLFVETSVVESIGTEVHLLLRFPNARRPVEARGNVIEVVGPRADSVAGRLNGVRGLRIELTEVGLKARDLMSAFMREARDEAAGASGT